MPTRDPREAARHHLIAVVPSRRRRRAARSARPGAQLAPDHTRRHRQRGRLLADEIVAAALDLANQRSRCSRRLSGVHEAALRRARTACARVDTRRTISSSRCSSTWSRSRACPHHHVATLGIASSSLEEEAAQARQEAQERVALDETAAERVADRHLAGARRLQQSRHADERIRAQLERIAQLGADAAHDQVDGLQALRPFSNTRDRRAP